MNCEEFWEPLQFWLLLTSIVCKNKIRIKKQTTTTTTTTKIHWDITQNIMLKICCASEKVMQVKGKLRQHDKVRYSSSQNNNKK